MNIFQESSTFAGWFSKVMRIFFQIRPLTTLGVINADAASTMTRILSLLLPLKVILLAASPGIPRWFPFIDPTAKTSWIIGLTIAAVVFFFITLLLESLVSRMSQDAGKEILYRANELTVLKNQEETVRDYYASFCGICSSLLFLCVAYLVLLILNFQLFVFMVAMTVSLFLFSGWAVSGCDINPGPMKRYIQEDVGGYMKILTSLSFLGAFLVILIPFIISGGGNIIIAILSIILIRRSLNFFVSSTRDITKLSKNKHEIDALIFPEVQLEEPESKDNLTVRDVFNKPARQRKAQEELGFVMPLSEPVEVHWMDPTTPGLYMFKIKSGAEGSGCESFFQQQAFPLKSLQLFENEDYLFTQVSRKEFKAPPLISRYTQAPFMCQIVDYGQGTPVSNKKWNALHDDLLEHYWSIQPPDNLIRAYRSSHKLLHELLSSDFINRVQIAVDTMEEENNLNRLLTELPVLKEILERAPHYIHNPGFTLQNTVQVDDENIYVMTWGKWTLEPVGAVMPYDKKRLGQMVENMSNARKDVPKDLRQEHLFLVFNCRKLGNEINRGAYKAALGTIGTLLSNPVRCW
jgi:hypothetical protein